MRRGTVRGGGGVWIQLYPRMKTFILSPLGLEPHPGESLLIPTAPTPLPTEDTQ